MPLVLKPEWIVTTRDYGASTTEMSRGLLELLGIDPEDIKWQDLSMCRGMDRELWFDKYESDEKVAQSTDEICLSCPVLKQCLMAGIENNEHGCWGGVFLVSGKPDKNRNSHKSDNTWNELQERIGDFL